MSVRPGGLVAAFALPAPLDVLSIAGEFIEHLYGTGETMVQFQGDRIIVTAPEVGFGPRKTSAPKLDMPAIDDTVVATSVTADGDELVLDFEHTQEALLAFTAGIRRWLDAEGATNFVTTRILHADDTEAYTITIGRPGRPTPADLYFAAKEKLDAIQRIIDERGLSDPTSEDVAKVLARE